MGNDGQLLQKANKIVYTAEPGHPCDSIYVEFECEVTFPDGSKSRMSLNNVVPAVNKEPGPTCGPINLTNEDACYFGDNTPFYNAKHENFCTEHVYERVATGGVHNLADRPTNRRFKPEKVKESR